MADIIVVFILVVILALAICYMVREKKKGHACIGCPNAANCSKKGHCAK